MTDSPMESGLPRRVMLVVVWVGAFFVVGSLVWQLVELANESQFAALRRNHIVSVLGTLAMLTFIISSFVSARRKVGS